MKFDNLQEKEIVSTGDIKNNAVSIDTANLDFIVTILSTNLYSNPIESFLRETVSNAWDSHVEAGNDSPVILKIGKDTEGQHYCSIQDFGVGLSPDRFSKIYRNIGSSTKRADNKQIGGFGIGRFSALAYSSTVHITSVYDGVKYRYLMYKDGNSVSIDLLHEIECDEPNGLEVKVDLNHEGDKYSFRQAIKKQLCFFDNLYVIDEEDKDFESSMNDLKIKNYENFMVNSLDSARDVSILLGKVRYPLRIGNLNKIYTASVTRYPISLKLDIGDVEITPNREEILYSDKSVKKIEEVFDAAIEEIDEMVKKVSVKDFTDFDEYREALDGTYRLKLLQDGSVTIPIPNSQTSLTYNGKAYNASILKVTYNVIEYMNFIKNDYIHSDGRISYSQNWFCISQIKQKFGDIYFADMPSLKKISKDYIRDTFDSNSFFFKPISAKSLLFQFIRNLKAEQGQYKGVYGGTFNYHSKYVKLVLSEIAQNYFKVQKFTDKSVPKKWIADVKAERKRQRALKKRQGYDPKESITLYKMRNAHSGGGSATDSVSIKLNGLSKKYKSLCIYAEKDHPKIEAFYNVFHSHVKIFKVAPTKVKILTKIDNFEYIDDFMEDVKFKQIRNIGTAVYIKKTLPYVHDLYYTQGIERISKKLKEMVEKLHHFVQDYIDRVDLDSDSSYRKDEKDLVLETYDLCIEHNYFNEEIKGLLDENKTMLVNAQCLTFLSTKDSSYSSLRCIKEESVNICVDYILARKLFRPDFEAVKKLKEETIFNIKPQKTEEDENN